MLIQFCFIIFNIILSRSKNSKFRGKLFLIKFLNKKQAFISEFIFCQSFHLGKIQSKLLPNLLEFWLFVFFLTNLNQISKIFFEKRRKNTNFVINSSDFWLVFRISCIRLWNALKTRPKTSFLTISLFFSVNKLVSKKFCSGLKTFPIKFEGFCTLIEARFILNFAGIPLNGYGFWMHSKKFLGFTSRFSKEDFENFSIIGLMRVFIVLFSLFSKFWMKLWLISLCSLNIEKKIKNIC